MKVWPVVLGLFIFYGGIAQGQACPDNISFSMSSLTNWEAYTGNNRNGNGASAIKITYKANVAAPAGTIGATAISEYNLSYPPGIQVNNAQGADYFGGFPTIPNINGYQYTNSVMIGSTSVAIPQAANQGPQGGYIRGIKYDFIVPAGPIGEPYTMTYAYAMVLENGSHNSNEQPLFSATLSTDDSVISCASPKYFLPTYNGVQEGARGAILDSAYAIRAGFKVSSRLSPNVTPVGPGQGVLHLQDVWTKGWTEVTFDLSAFRGRKVTLTFESDNCIPGGHFAYAYVALRNNCAGLQIGGEPIVCTNASLTYSIPALTGAVYEWSVPAGWSITSATDTSVIRVVAGSQPGLLIVHQKNGCADLRDTLKVKTTPPTLAGEVSGDTTVCTGVNNNPLLLSGIRGNILKWISSTDGANWNPIQNTGLSYIAKDLSATTIYRALVQNGNTCNIDTSLAATVAVDQKSVGGRISPANTNICRGQDPIAFMTLKNNTGAVLNWQSTLDGVNWSDMSPAVHDSAFQATGITSSIEFRSIVKNGVCVADTSGLAKVEIFSADFPQARINPKDTTICYGGVAGLDVAISIGTSYTWGNYNGLSNPGDGNIMATPLVIQALASPLTTTDYILIVQNAGCPNNLLDTFHVNVLAPILVDAGRDTAVVVNQPLQLNASSSETGDSFVWTPSIGLNDQFIPNPVGVFDASTDSVRFLVTATSSFGCFGTAEVLVKVFKTGPDIFVPNAFTPGKSSNAVFRPIPVGIASIQYFRIFNRWGQIVFNTARAGDGWDGSVDGKAQTGGSYVWMVQGTSYTGKTIFKKGVMTLIR
jgi:hypothetical protein